MAAILADGSGRSCCYLQVCIPVTIAPLQLLKYHEAVVLVSKPCTVFCHTELQNVIKSTDAGLLR